MKTFRLLVALAALAPAHGNRVAAQVADATPLVCGPARERTLVHILADAADAANQVRAAARAAGVDSARGLVFVAPGLGARVISGNVPQTVVDSLTPMLLERTAARSTAANPPLAMILRLDPLPLPACGARPRRESLGRGLNNGELPSVLRDLAIAHRRVSPVRGPALLRIVITRDGEVVSAELLPQRSTVRLEEGVLGIARRLRYRPASLDGVPVDIVLHIPTSL